MVLAISTISTISTISFISPSSLAKISNNTIATQSHLVETLPGCDLKIIRVAGLLRLLVIFLMIICLGQQHHHLSLPLHLGHLAGFVGDDLPLLPDVALVPDQDHVRHLLGDSVIFICYYDLVGAQDREN